MKRVLTACAVIGLCVSLRVSAQSEAGYRANIGKTAVSAADGTEIGQDRRCRDDERRLGLQSAAGGENHQLAGRDHRREGCGVETRQGAGASSPTKGPGRRRRKATSSRFCSAPPSRSARSSSGTRACCRPSSSRRRASRRSGARAKCSYFESELIDLLVEHQADPEGLAGDPRHAYLRGQGARVYRQGRDVSPVSDRRNQRSESPGGHQVGSVRPWSTRSLAFPNCSWRPHPSTRDAARFGYARLADKWLTRRLVSTRLRSWLADYRSLGTGRSIQQPSGPYARSLCATSCAWRPELRDRRPALSWYIRSSAATSSSSNVLPSTGKRAVPALIERDDPDARPRLERVRPDRALELEHAPRLVLGAAVPHDHHELVSRKPRAQVVLADRRAQHGADRAQRPVARLVPVGVVDLLEPIEIEHHDADAALGARGAHQPRLELQIERSPVRQPGQRIGVRFVLGLLEARRVEDDRGGLLADAVQDAAVLVGEAARRRCGKSPARR